MGKGARVRPVLPAAPTQTPSGVWPPLVDLARLVRSASGRDVDLGVHVGGADFLIIADGRVVPSALPARVACGADPVIDLVAFDRSADEYVFAADLTAPTREHVDGLYGLTISELGGGATVKADELVLQVVESLVQAHGLPGWCFHAYEGRPTEAVHRAGAAAVGTEVAFERELADWDAARSLADAQARAAAAGLRLVRLRDLGDRALPETSTFTHEVWRDMPLPARFAPPAAAEIGHWLEDPFSLPCSSALLAPDGTVVGLSVIDAISEEFPGIPAGATGTGALTALRAPWRGRGLGKALKLASLAWAAEAGVIEVGSATYAGGRMERVLLDLGFRRDPAATFELFEKHRG